MHTILITGFGRWHRRSRGEAVVLAMIPLARGP
jgi:hypothetical protein